MRYSSLFIAASLAVGVAAATLPETASATHWTKEELKCRSTVYKNGAKYAKTALKYMTACHKERDADGSLSGTQCNNLIAVDGFSEGKVDSGGDKAEGKIVDKCTDDVDLETVFYENCPAPCTAAINTAADLGACIRCLTDDGLQDLGREGFGSPNPPLEQEFNANYDCHIALTKNGAKLFNSAMKVVTKCQEDYDEMDDYTNCSGTGFNVLTQDAYDDCKAAIQDACDGKPPKLAPAQLPSAAMDPCEGSNSPEALAGCVCDWARDMSQRLGQQYVALNATTTTTVTTTTTLPTSDPTCPDLGKLVLYSHDSQVECDDNTDCASVPPRTCDTTIGLCTTVASLDSGWTGLAHHSDINDQVATMAHLYCPDTDAGPGCGMCDIVGIDPTPGNCRCSNNPRTICDQPFNHASEDCPMCVGGSSVAGSSCSDNSDCDSGTCSGRCSGDFTRTCFINGDCTGFGTCSLITSGKQKCLNGDFCTVDEDCQGLCTGKAGCDCYFGSPFPLNSGGTAACIVNKFANDITGTANVDEGSGDITANLSTLVYLDVSKGQPCPVCGGKCNTGGAACISNSDCGGNAPCNQDVAGDTNRNGICIGGQYAGQSCDAMGFNPTFPARVTAGVAQVPAGGQYSLDCQPTDGLNVSGLGLAIDLEQTTGSASLTSNLSCGGLYPGEFCPCKQCSKDKFVACTDDSQCTPQGTFCNAYNNPTTFLCDDNSDCDFVDTGTCTANANTRCSNASSKACTSNTDCGMQPGGVCALCTCSSDGIGVPTEPNGCLSHLCTDVGDGIHGTCSSGPNVKYCDGLVRIDGTGMVGCTVDADCTISGVQYGNCTLTSTRACFLPTISATGDPDPDYPVAASVFCVPPVDNGGINSAAGLPGPGRVVSQGAATTYCSTAHGTEYTPGGGSCPP